MIKTTAYYYLYFKPRIALSLVGTVLYLVAKHRYVKAVYPDTLVMCREVNMWPWTSRTPPIIDSQTPSLS